MQLLSGCMTINQGELLNPRFEAKSSRIERMSLRLSAPKFSGYAATARMSSCLMWAR
jgi:hypothetical protein